MYPLAAKGDVTGVIQKSIDKCNKYLSLLSFAKSVRLLDPRQRPKLDNNVSAYVTQDKRDKGDGPIYRVIPESERAGIEEHEWDKYWALPEVPSKPIAVIGWWVGQQSQFPRLAKLALRTLPIPHTGVDVERSFSYYRMSRSVLQSALTPAHHIGRLSFRMNAIVPPLVNK